MLPGNWSGPTRLALPLRTLFAWTWGSRIHDNTVMPKPCATARAGLAWVFASQERQPVDGFSLGLLVWTHGPIQLP